MERPLPVDIAAGKPMDGERQHLLLQENAPPDMTGYVLCAVCVFFLANPIFGAVAFILAGKYTSVYNQGRKLFVCVCVCVCLLSMGPGLSEINNLIDCLFVCLID